MNSSNSSTTSATSTRRGALGWLGDVDGSRYRVPGRRRRADLRLRHHQVDKTMATKAWRAAVRRLVTLAAIACAAGAAMAQSPYRLVIFEPLQLGGFIPNALNEQGHLAGCSWQADDCHVIVIKDGVSEDLGPGEPTAINARDQVVGAKFGDDGLPRATIWGRSGARTLSTVGMNSAAFSLNDKGEVVGFTRVQARPYPTFYVTHWYRGRTSYFGLGQARDISSDGRMVGYHLPSTTDLPRAARWEDGAMTLIGGPNSVANAINEVGQIVGAEGDFAHVWDGAVSTALAPVVGTVSYASDINRAGDAVGVSLPNPSNGYDYRATLWRSVDGGYAATDINTLLRPGAPEAGWVLMQAVKINDRGDIIGRAMNITLCETTGACDHGFLLSYSSLPDQYPVPPMPGPVHAMTPR